MKSPIQYIRQFLSVRLSLWIVLFATIIFLGALGYVFSMAKKTAHQETIKHVTQILDNNVLRLTTIINKAEMAAKMTQWLVMRHDEVSDSMFVYSASTLKSDPDFYNCSISFDGYFYPDYGQYFSAYSVRQGDSISTLQRGSDKYPYLDTDWYQKTKLEGKPYWTEPYLDPDTTDTTGTTVISYCMPVYNRRNKTIGVITSSLSLDWLSQTISATKPFPNSYIVLTGKDGTFYVHPNTAKVLKQNIFTTPQEHSDTAMASLKYALQEEKQGMKQMRIEGEECYVFYQTISKTEWGMAIVCNKDDIFSELNRLRHAVELIFVVGLLLILIIFSQIVAKELRPLELLATEAETIASGQFNNTLPPTNRKDEIGKLTASFANMQQSLVGYMEELKNTTTKKERIESELRIAHDIQMAMVPDKFPQRKDLDIYATMTPAKEVGGDLFDFVIDRDQLFFIIGDVAGKGVPGSFYMAVTCALFRNLAGNYQSAGNIVREINRTITSNNTSFVFVTMFMGVLDMKTHHLTYCNAAQNPPVLIQPDGKCMFLKTEVNIPIGVEDHYPFVEQHIDFPEGSALLLYTDGLTEATFLPDDNKPQMFGEQRIIHDVEKNCKASAKEVVDYLTQHVNIFANGTEQNDDLTLMCIRHAETDYNSTTTKHRLIIKNELSEVSRMHTFIMTVCREYGIPNGIDKTLNLALEEWVVNVINYAYPKGMRGHVEMTSDFNNGLLTLVVKDHGVAFDPTQHSEVDIDASLEERVVGGLGIHLVRSIMDSMTYERTVDGYNVVTMTKRIDNK
ncbi:MAG: SpoIIE family protein phosphatase [Bacteroidaceae bacterium]|nr:SpoIIE family protein phosphatase [Bacteroidaceae bacterium]